MPHTPNTGRAVGADFRLPHNTEWTMADEWAITKRQCENISYRQERAPPKHRRSLPKLPSKPGKPTPWTPENIDTLKALWFAGATCTQIVNEMGNRFTKNAVAGKVRRMDLPMRKHQAPRKVA